MRNRRCLNNVLSTDRKILYMFLSIVIVSVLTLTVVYAALSTTLNINGNAEVSAANWDIHLDNVVLNSSSATTTAPTITDSKTVTFSTTLTKPGDFYEFTIDVVNDGTIDAMIGSVTKTSTLTETQAKYLNYIVEYQNGESITTKQLVSKNSYVRLLVKVEFRKDISASDLPTTSETLNLAFTVNYVQADEAGTATVPDNGVKKVVKVVKGDGTQKSDEICIGEECFYVISSTDEEVKMLAKYNLHVGNKYDSTNGAVPLENPTGIQDETAIGWFSGYTVENPLIGTKQFSGTDYWLSTTSTYPAYVYNENSYLYEYVENYKSHLEGLGAEVNEARLITIEELEGLGCSRSSYSCSEAPEWVYSTTYWSGAASSSSLIWFVLSASRFSNGNYSLNSYGVRPVITISRSLI